MAPKQLKVPKKKPALEDLDKFENSRHLTQVMHDTLVALSTRVEHDGPGLAIDPHLIKIDPRNGEGLLMDYDVSLNMGVELKMLHPYFGRPVEHVAYYMSMEESPVGGLKLTRDQWLDVIKENSVEGIEGVPVSPEVQKKVEEWLLGLHARLSMNKKTKTLAQDIIDTWVEGREEGTSEQEEETKGKRRWEVLPLDSIPMEDLD